MTAVVFDLDGTLIDSYAAIHDSLSAVLESFSRPAISREETRRMVGHGLEILIERAVGKDQVAEGVRIFRARYEKVGLESTRLLPGADEVTRVLKERSVPLIVASNKPAFFSRQILAHLGIAGRFAVVTGPDDGFPPKPAPHMVFVALGTVGARAEDSLYVGDMPVDVATARAAGIPVAVLPTGSSTREELASTSPDHLLESLHEVPALVHRPDRVH